ncbi:MAG: hypothetical protein COV78_00130 [Candidatus Pacebacteria bacterium CG11_big_fil_rev_8_21_14_0_20_34_55]|nr:MAG: hypothetical protein COV78_00130 [Candidatus Pacebacteria bacterium CG11_big_fil_rev_8_21_14_0_20_34_55]
MKTKFTKFSKTDAHVMQKWASFFHAGDAWLASLQVLEDGKDQIGWGIFYVKPWVVAFCLELYVKAIASHADNFFNGGDYRHGVTEILKKYFSISFFGEILKDDELMILIREYEKTIDTKYGETYVSINGDDQQKIIDLVYKLREEISSRTGLR